MNREERRRYKKKYAHNKYAQMCPYCKMKTLWHMNEQKQIICEVCENVLFTIPEKKEEETPTMEYPQVDGITPFVI